MNRGDESCKINRVSLSQYHCGAVEASRTAARTSGVRIPNWRRKKNSRGCHNSQTTQRILPKFGMEIKENPFYVFVRPETHLADGDDDME